MVARRRFSPEELKPKTLAEQISLNEDQLRLDAFKENLPYPNTLAEAYWLAELARMCHARLKANAEAPAGFWTLLDTDEANRLYGFLRDAGDGLLLAANDLQYMVQPEPTLLEECDDVCDTATDVIRCVNARLQRLGRQLDSFYRDELQLALEKVIGEAAVEFIEDEENRVDPNEPPPEVEGMFSMIEKLGRDYPDKPEMLAEVRAACAKFLQECNAPQEVG